jgi:hypothetical protein
MIVAQLQGKKMYLMFTVAVGVIAFLSCGLTFFFPFREAKSSKSYIATS